MTYYEKAEEFLRVGGLQAQHVSLFAFATYLDTREQKEEKCLACPCGDDYKGHHCVHCHKVYCHFPSPAPIKPVELIGYLKPIDKDKDWVLNQMRCQIEVAFNKINELCALVNKLIEQK